MTQLTTVELCAGTGGQALGLEQAGFHHRALVEIDPHCCATLKFNRPAWTVMQTDLRAFNGKAFGFTVVVCVVVYTTAQALVSARLKVPYVEPDGKR